MNTVESERLAVYLTIHEVGDIYSMSNWTWLDVGTKDHIVYKRDTLL